MPLGDGRVVAALTALLCLAMAACSVGRSATPAPTQAGETGEASVSFMVFGDPAELAAYEALVAAFEAARPEIGVDLIHVPSQGDYRERLGNDFAAGTPADVVLINYRRYAPFAQAGALEPLGPYLDRSSVTHDADFYPETTTPFRWRGQLMCIPQNLSSLVVYYNKDLFAAAGLEDPAADWTWDDFLSTAKALTVDTDGDSVTDQHGLGTEVSIFRIAPFIWQNAGELVDNLRKPGRLAIDSPEAREAIQFFVDLQVRHHVVPNAAEEESEDSESRFMNGRTAMFLNSRRGVPTYREITAFDWDVAPLPQGRQPAGILHSDAFCMPAAADEKDSIWALIEFANSVEGQTILATSGRTVPSLRSVAESEAFLDPDIKPANSRVFLDTIPVIRAVPVHPGWVDVEELSVEEFERAFYGDASVDEVIRSAIDRTTRFFTEVE